MLDVRDTEGLMCERPTVSATVSKASTLLDVAMCSLRVTCQRSHTDIQVALPAAKVRSLQADEASPGAPQASGCNLKANVCE